MFAKILIIDLTSQKASIEQIDLKEGLLGGSGLAASLYLKYGLFEEPAFHPDQDRKSTRLNSITDQSRMPSSA